MVNVFKTKEATEVKRPDTSKYKNIENFLEDSNFSEAEKDNLNMLIMSGMERKDSTDYMNLLDKSISEEFYTVK